MELVEELIDSFVKMCLAEQHRNSELQTPVATIGCTSFLISN